MKSKWTKRMIAALLACIMIVSLCAGCNTEKPVETKPNDKPVETKPGETKPAETEEKLDRVDLVFYLAGNAPNDMQKVEDKINEILLEKINTTISFQHLTWTEGSNKYNLILSSGEECDLIYTATWMQYQRYATEGAFLPLDELLDNELADVKAMGSEDMWNQMRVDGSVYSVPQFAGEYNLIGICYRKDLADKLNLPAPDSVANLEAYIDGILANDPTQKLFDFHASTDSSQYNFAAQSLLCLDWTFLNQPQYGLVFDYNNPSVLMNYWESDQFREEMKTMKRWAEKGYWPKNALSINETSEVTDGTGVVKMCNPTQYTQYVDTIAQDHPDWELDYIPLAYKTGFAYANHPAGNGTAIPLHSKNPERAAMALELLMTDQELNRLFLYGIEGEHYTIDANGYYVNGPANSDYVFEGSNAWNLRNSEYGLIREVDALKYDIFDKLHEIALKTNTPDIDIWAGFAEDTTNYSAERAAVISVMVQYMNPIAAGMMDDVDAAIDEMLAKLEEAGLDKIQEEYTKQWVAYCEANGY